VVIASRENIATVARLQHRCCCRTIIGEQKKWSTTYSSSPPIQSSPSETNYKFILKNNKKKLNPVELTQIYELFHLVLFSDNEVETVTDEILLMKTSSNLITEESSPSKELNHNNIDMITTEKVSLLLQSRMRQYLERTLTGELQQPSDDTKGARDNFDSQNQAPAKFINDKLEQQLDLRIRTYSDIMATRLMYHLICEQKPKATTESLEDALQMTKLQFTQGLKALTTNIDYKRVLPISLSMILVGTSVGIIVPLMPFIAEQISLSPGDYGMVISAFALSKLIGNVPSAILVDLHGRKPFMVYSLTLIAMGVGGIGFATTLDHLVACRLIAGFGVAALSTAATLTITDISTPRNRASTMAPMNSGFAAGMVLGPAIGGFLGDQLGVSKTFFAVGASYLGVAALNSAFLIETKTERSNPQQWLIDVVGNEKPSGEEENKEEQIKRGSNTANAKRPTTTTSSAIQDALGQWAPLLSIPSVKRTVILNGCYWVALSGAQMTLLPLMLTNPAGLALSASSLGKIYMGMSVVQVFGNPSVARVVDRIGKVPSIIGGCTAISTAMFAVPFCTDTYQLAIALGFWSLGSTALSTAPMAHMADLVPTEKRAQALALLRTAGDIGFLFGATGTGALANWTGSMDLAMQGCSAFLLTATCWYTTRCKSR